MNNNFSSSKRNVINMNDDLLIPEWAKKDESLKERLTDKKKVTKFNPDRLNPMIEEIIEIKVKSVRNNKLNDKQSSGRLGVGSKSSIPSTALLTAQPSSATAGVNHEY